MVIPRSSSALYYKQHTYSSNIIPFSRFSHSAFAPSIVPPFPLTLNFSPSSSPFPIKIPPPLPLCFHLPTPHNVQARSETYCHLGLRESANLPFTRPAARIGSLASCTSRSPVHVSSCHRPARGASSLNASFRMPSRNAPTFQYPSKSNTAHSYSTRPCPPSPLIRTSGSEERLVEKDGRDASLWPRNEAKPWASICKSSISSFYSLPLLCATRFLVRMV